MKIAYEITPDRKTVYMLVNGEVRAMTEKEAGINIDLDVDFSKNYYIKRRGKRVLIKLLAVSVNFVGDEQYTYDYKAEITTYSGQTKELSFKKLIY